MLKNFKIATWNVNSLRVRLPQLLEWLRQNQPDVIALQETKVEDHLFPFAEITAAGYQVVFSGQKSYNGVALLSRLPISACVTEIPDFTDPQRRILMATVNDIRIVNVYVPNGASLTSEKYQYKLDWLSRVNALLKNEQREHPKMVVLGDFNIAPEERDIYDPPSWEGQILVSPPEKQALNDLLKLGFVDSFRLFEQEAGHFTWWDYRMAAFRRNLGARIDHILLSEKLRDSCKSCMIDKQPRSLERPSDHAPVIALLN